MRRKKQETKTRPPTVADARLLVERLRKELGPAKGGEKKGDLLRGATMLLSGGVLETYCKGKRGTMPLDSEAALHYGRVQSALTTSAEEYERRFGDLL